MPTPSFKAENEYLNIAVAVELDKGKNIKEVAKQFGISERSVMNLVNKLDTDEAKPKKTKQKKFSEVERELLAQRVGSGEDLEDVAVEAGVAESTLKRWCKNQGIEIPRQLNQLNLAEQNEIREMLESQNPQEVASAYHVSIATIEALSEPEYKKLDSASLSYVFELLKEKPKTSASKLSLMAKHAGLDIAENAIESYRKRLQSLNML